MTPDYHYLEVLGQEQRETEVILPMNSISFTNNFRHLPHLSNEYLLCMMLL